MNIDLSGVWGWVVGGGLLSVGALLHKLFALHLKWKQSIVDLEIKSRHADDNFEHGLRDELRRDVDRLRVQMDAERLLWNSERAICDGKIAVLTERIRSLEKQLIEVQNESRKSGQGICRICLGSLGEGESGGSSQTGVEAKE